MEGINLITLLWSEGESLIRDCDWRRLTHLRSNRLMNPDRTGNRAVADCNIAHSACKHPR